MWQDKTMRLKPQKGARNGIQETRNCSEEPCQADLRGWLWREYSSPPPLLYTKQELQLHGSYVILYNESLVLFAGLSELFHRGHSGAYDGIKM